MDISAATKTCKMCCMDIPQQARKCPHCQHFQDRWTKLMFHPAFLASIMIAPMLLMFGLLTTSVFDKGEDFESHRGEVTITDTGIRMGRSERGVTVSVMGTMKNAGNVPWKDVTLHVEFMDAAGNLVDTGDKKDFYFLLPARASSPFKITFPCDFPDAEYASAQVSITSAKDARSRF